MPTIPPAPDPAARPADAPVVDPPAREPVDQARPSPTAFGQPYLHDLALVVRAPGVALSAPDGQLHTGAHGAYWGDRRLLSRLIVGADGQAPVGVRAAAIAPGHVRFLGVLRELGDTGADPTVTVQRDREVRDGGVVETVTVRSSARQPVRTRLEVGIGCDLADMATVKAGGGSAPLPTVPTADGCTWTDGQGRTVHLHADPPPQRSDTEDVLHWPVHLDPGGSVTVTLRAKLATAAPPVTLPAPGGLGARLRVTGGDQRLGGLVAQSLADLDSLCVADPLSTSDRFLAAGAPWYLTLFGRDAIWSARMLLPVSLELAAGTLRALARRQGTVVDSDSAQEPGKIMHEIRAEATAHDSDAGRFHLPPLYYGTVDATALWLLLLHDAWRWGLPADQVTDLLPVAERAVGWIVEHGVGDGGFVSYRDESGAGLANQGWKDSGDSVQFGDGTLATAPISLCEVQGYAFAALRAAAELFEAFGRGGAARCRERADALATAFRAAFWVRDPDGDYPAIALDADGTPVDTVTSNIAHLLGTGLLTPAEEALVVDRLGRRDLDSGHGLRTMSSTARGFNPLAYHGGSVWTHDTAIAITGLARSSAPAAAGVAARLAEGLLAAAPAFGFRLPELFGGHAREQFPEPVPYPAACRPQAWSAAASVAVVSALLGLRADVPAGTVHLRPLRPSPVGAFEVHGLRVGATTFGVSVDAAGDPAVHGLGLTVVVS